MNEVLVKISKLGIVPVVVINDVEKAVPLAKALVEGGLPCAEVTFRTAEAEEAIKRMTAAYPEMLVGAGTVLTIEQVDRAVAAGAKFIVSPGLDEEVVQYCLDKNIPVTPGVITPSEVTKAYKMGLEVVKFFPAESFGGVKTIKALAAPFTTMKFMPTGGINAKNINDYLAFPKIIACGGSWMVDAALVKENKFDAICEMTKEAVQTMLGFELAHVGINAENADCATATAQAFEAAFGFASKIGNSSVFAGTAVEVMKEPYLGKNGHIGIATKSLPRAIAYLESKGYEFDEATAKTDAAGNMVAIYFKQDFNGFAVHLVQKK